MLRGGQFSSQLDSMPVESIVGSAIRRAGAAGVLGIHALRLHCAEEALQLMKGQLHSMRKWVLWLQNE